MTPNARTRWFATIKLCQELGLDAVAEGVETEHERDVLGGLGCGRGQGYLLARPMEPDRTTAWLAKDAPVVGTRYARSG